MYIITFYCNGTSLRVSISALVAAGWRLYGYTYCYTYYNIIAVSSAAAAESMMGAVRRQRWRQWFLFFVTFIARGERRALGQIIDTRAMRIYIWHEIYAREQAEPVDGAVKSVRAHKLLCHSRLWAFRVQRPCRHVTDEKLKPVLDNNTDLSTWFSKPTTGSGFVFYTLLPVQGYRINTFIV
jgi:hypothetical protein